MPGLAAAHHKAAATMTAPLGSSPHHEAIRHAEERDTAGRGAPRVPSAARAEPTHGLHREEKAGGLLVGKLAAVTVEEMASVTAREGEAKAMAILVERAAFILEEKREEKETVETDSARTTVVLKRCVLCFRFIADVILTASPTQKASAVAVPRSRRGGVQPRSHPNPPTR